MVESKICFVISIEHKKYSNIQTDTYMVIDTDTTAVDTNKYSYKMINSASMLLQYYVVKTTMHDTDIKTYSILSV
jgi:hypothetical protein